MSYLLIIFAQNFYQLSKTYSYKVILTKNLQINIAQGAINIANSFSDELSVDCSVSESPELSENEALLFKSSDAICNFYVPRNRSIVINGKNLRLNFSKLKNNITATVDRGEVTFLPRWGTRYNYNLNIEGVTKFKGFTSSPHSRAYRISIKTDKGYFRKR
jgi:hypothetical protein